MRDDKETRVLDAAATVFLRYGYRKTTMGDLAKAAGISRPALYLLFCNKERIFEAALRRLTVNLLEEIKEGIARQESPRERLELAFELWAVRPFAMLMDSPDAHDLISCSLEFAEATMDQNYAAFESLLVSILGAFPGPKPAETPCLEQIAHVLAVSVRGFKSSARNVQELKDMIRTLLNLTVASLQPVPTPP